jgi:methanol--5-hydroxybenzimidazolylcobamide Co-methyltransferase
METNCYVEQLIYDCRLFNQAIADGPEAAAMLKRWLVRSDALLDPQAYILAPESAISIARAIVSADAVVPLPRRAAGPAGGS